MLLSVAPARRGRAHGRPAAGDRRRAGSWPTGRWPRCWAPTASPSAPPTPAPSLALGPVAGLRGRARGRRCAGRHRCLAGRRRRRRGRRRSRALRPPAAAARPGGRLLLPHRGLSRHSHFWRSSHDRRSCSPVPSRRRSSGRSSLPAPGRPGGPQVAVHPVRGRAGRRRGAARPRRDDGGGRRTPSEPLDIVDRPARRDRHARRCWCSSRSGCCRPPGSGATAACRPRYLLEPRRGRVLAAKAARRGSDRGRRRRRSPRGSRPRCWR